MARLKPEDDPRGAARAKTKARESPNLVPNQNRVLIRPSLPMLPVRLKGKRLIRT